MFLLDCSFFLSIKCILSVNINVFETILFVNKLLLIDFCGKINYQKRGLIAIISLKLGKDGKCLINLTETTIDSINFVTEENTNIDMGERQTEDIELIISVDNSNLDELYKEKMDEEDEDEETPPREIDSVRDLLAYANAPFESDLCYLSGELEIIDGATKTVSRFNYDNLFVIKIEERLSLGSRYTYINITLRQEVKAWR